MIHGNTYAHIGIGKKKFLHLWKVSEMTKTEYSFVIDSVGNKLSPTKIQKAWYFIRHGKAKLVSMFPMKIMLYKSICKDDLCKDAIVAGVYEDSLNVGVSVIQKCMTRNKVLFNGIIEQRKDVHKLMELRKWYRGFHRRNKRHRKARFLNRSSSKRIGRLSPTVLQKKQSIYRVMSELNKSLMISCIYISSHMFNNDSILGNTKYSWINFKKSRLDENVRKYVVLRDNCKCRVCGKSNTKLEVHHIVPKRSGGTDNVNNLITLCRECHIKTFKKEEMFIDYFKNILCCKTTCKKDFSEHIYQGNKWLYTELSKLCSTVKCYKCDAINVLIDNGLCKSYVNLAMCSTGCVSNDDVINYFIKPIRKRSKATISEVDGYRHRDIVKYTYRNGNTFCGYVTALYPISHKLNFKSKMKHCKCVRIDKCKFIYRFNNIYWFTEYMV